jgi:hypothetical protein
LFVATGSAAEEHGDETFVKYQCMFDNESRRRHEIDLPEAFLKEHHNYHAESSSSHPRRCHHEDSVHVPKTRDITITPRFSRRRLAPKMALQDSGPFALLPTVMPSPGDQSPTSGVYGVGPDAQANTVLTQYKKCSFGAHPARNAGNGVQNGVVDVNAPSTLPRATSVIANADYSRNGEPVGHCRPASIRRIHL